jgi:hypothetical protein
MAIRKAGSLWLVAHLELTNIQLTHRSYIGTRDKIEVDSDGSIDQSYGPKYAPKKDDMFSHIKFMLKYDEELKIGGIAGGNYIDLLDPECYITGKIVKNARWRMNDNLIGVSEYFLKE